MIKSNAIANTLLMFTPIILVVFVIVVMTPVLSLLIIGFGYILGLTMLTQSKWSQFRQRIYFAFGPGRLDVKNRRRYFKGYAIIGCAMLLNAAKIALGPY